MEVKFEQICTFQPNISENQEKKYPKGIERDKCNNLFLDSKSKKEKFEHTKHDLQLENDTECFNHPKTQSFPYRTKFLRDIRIIKLDRQYEIKCTITNLIKASNCKDENNQYQDDKTNANFVGIKNKMVDNLVNKGRRMSAIKEMNSMLEENDFENTISMKTFRQSNEIETLEKAYYNDLFHNNRIDPLKKSKNI